MNQDFRFSSFPRQRESSKLLKRLDTRFHGYDDTQFMSESPVNEWSREPATLMQSKSFSYHWRICLCPKCCCYCWRCWCLP
ncbi:hypothetical protein BN874_170020 [Candidatus Contendobacter odensis Run_B_J11]|uniref:Uncharacterized protein n=1 Tax=Candidatus Contendobacter odensis Run_B_J11 TaxID=1400861 RepID=A0A7U7GAH2_9GAMM|nr:hypothetical protein BN874_170020 [Candidatus Contendobacter odensis Run_B_J11]